MNIDFLKFYDSTAKSQFLKNIAEDAESTMKDEEIIKKLKIIKIITSFQGSECFYLFSL